MSAVSSPNQATMFRFPECPLLIINAYFPCDVKSSQYDLEELYNLLSDVDTIIRNNDFANIMLVGDFNCHFQRNSKFTSTVENWLRDVHLKSLWTIDDSRVEDVDFTFTKVVNDSVFYSMIDHFAVCDRMISGLESASVLHDGTNTSNHSPIFATFDVGKMDLQTEQIGRHSRVSWDNASEDAKSNFKSVLESRLHSIQYDNMCCNPKCKSDYCKDQLENFTISVLEAVELAGSECLPHSISGCKT